MSGSKGRNLESITPEAIYTSRPGGQKRPALPPILCDRDKQVVASVRKFIDDEKEKLQYTNQETNPERFSIFSEALNQIISNVTVYKDILADVKREHDECITAIKNGQKETSYLQNKIKTLSNISTTIAGYSRRKRDLEEKLEILQEDNKRLEDELEDLLKSDEEDEVEEEPRLVESPQEKEDRRPIPGISVEDWTNEKLLQELVVKLDTAIEDVFNKQKCLYVPISRKYEVDTLLQDRIEARDELLAEGKLLRRSNAVYKIALDAVNDFNSSDEIIDEDLGEYLIRVLQNENYLERRSSSVTSLTGQSIHEDDDPTKEKEAETILEYIDKFNELFADGLFNQAAVHAANSPRGVLRSIETMDRFKEVSNNYQGTPTPLLMYAEALMHASNAQDHVADAEMSTVLSRCALNEHRPDLVEHWTIKRCITPCAEVAHELVAYSETNPQHQALCLFTAQSIFTEVKSHMDACVTMYKLGHLGGLVDYAKNVAQFTRMEFLNLIQRCPNSSLMWSLCRPPAELTPDPQEQRDPNLPIYQLYALPLRVDQAIVSLISSSEVGKSVAVDVIDDLYQGVIVSEDVVTTETLFEVVYDETDGDLPPNDTDDWSCVIKFCSSNQLIDAALEIQASRIVKVAVTKSLQAIALDEKEEFDYYT